MLHIFKKHKKAIIETAVLCILFLILVSISFYQVEQSISLTKFHFQWGIQSLLKNYSLYHQSFQEFLWKTNAFHTASSMEGWNAFIYLWPLFIFSDFLLGGLNIINMYFFVIIVSLLFIIVFYLWIRGAWGKQVALYAAFMLGFSSIFQHMARSGTYHTYSLFLGIIWILFFFHCSKSLKARDFFLLGILTGLTWYGYGILRYLTIVIIAYGAFFKISRKFLVILLFLAGALLILLPGILLKLETRQISLNKNNKPMYLSFFDKAASFRQEVPVKAVLSNLRIFGNEILGIPQKGRYGLWNPLLTIPLLIGIGCAIKSRKEPSSQLLLLLAFIIYLAPCFIVSKIYDKRLLLYIIPSYCFIGLGIKEIVSWMGALRSSWLKYSLVFLSLLFIITVLQNESYLFRMKVLSHQNKTSIQFLEFADQIRKSGICGTIYYLDGKKSLMKGTKESDLLKTVFFSHKGNCFNIKSQAIMNNWSNTFEGGYLVKGFLISNQEFKNWCSRNRLKVALILEYPTRKKSHRKYGHSLKLYAIRKIEAPY